MALALSAKSEELVRSVKVCVGKEWVEHSFHKPVPRDEAMKRARQILESLA